MKTFHTHINNAFLYYKDGSLGSLLVWQVYILYTRYVILSMCVCVCCRIKFVRAMKFAFSSLHFAVCILIKNQSIHKLASCTRCVSMVVLVSGCHVSIKVFPCVYNQRGVMTVRMEIQ